MKDHSNDDDTTSDDHSVTNSLCQTSEETRKSRVEDKEAIELSTVYCEVNTDHPPRSAKLDVSTEEISTFNVGGTIFETYRSTLSKLPNSPLADQAFLQKHFRHDRGHYFFDRDPDVFGAILNYVRTGELHLPIKYCGPAVKAELQFWGIWEDEIEECCWSKYSSWHTTLEALRKLEKDRKIHMPRSVDQVLQNSHVPLTRLRRVQLKGWTLLNSPQSSLPAKIYSYVSLIFVVVSIFSFAAQTHSLFRASQGGTEDGSANYPLNTSANGTASHGNQTADGKDEDDVLPFMLYIDITCFAFFVIEFVLRFIFSPRKCRLLLLPMTVFELLALLPDVIELGLRVFNLTLSSLGAADVLIFLRLLRVFRIFRLMRHFPGLWILFYTLRASYKELLLLLMFLCVGMLFFASLIYYTDDGDVFTSIPAACWWSIVTMTTVGYGDMYPKKSLGYLVGSMTAVCGVLVIGFTVPVLVNNFILYYEHTQCAISREASRKRRAEAMTEDKKIPTPLHSP